MADQEDMAEVGISSVDIKLAVLVLTTQSAKVLLEPADLQRFSNADGRSVTIETRCASDFFILIRVGVKG
jgi:hypothetical protein